MATQRTRDTMTERIGALLNLADNAATPGEADACRDKAFALIAKHGITESEARSTHREGNNAVMAVPIRLTGHNLTQQRNLLARIADALHCTIVLTNNSRTTKTLKLYGVKIHTDRVQLLFNLLNLHMLANAEKITAPPGAPRGTRALRVDWMLGYATRIGERLAAAELSAATTRDTETGTNTHALALVSDRKRAEVALANQHPNTRNINADRRVDPTAYNQGRAAGDRASLTDRPQLHNRRVSDR